jgi:3-phosphoshikimate 1-carboxyvinyltransferase
MSRVLISPSALNGRVRVPVSKSAAHRALICSALAHSAEELLPPDEPLSEDLRATRSALHALLRAEGSGKSAEIDCGESGSTLRFLIPVAAALGLKTRFTGSGRLPERPLGVYLSLLPEHGVICESAGGLPLCIHGQLQSGVYSLPGNISSQFITGLLLALPLLGGDSRIELTAPLESAGYVDMTVRILKEFGVSVQTEPNGWSVPGGQKYRAKPGFAVERDWSQAAFFLEAAALGGTLELEGLDPRSCQGDRAAEALFQKLGAKTEWKNGILSAGPGFQSENPDEIRIDASQIPDLVPALAAAAALFAGHRTVIENAARLRLKESDRLSAMAEGLSRLGAKIRELPDGLVIDGVEFLNGGTGNGCNDHRVVMALAVAALKARGEIELSDAESIRKSYPGFFEDYRKLGGIVHELGN